jgi:hypothetical protein
MGKIIVTSEAVIMIAGTARLCHRCGYGDGIEKWNNEKH